MTQRMNPQTNQPFKRGDEREDGRLFYKYTRRLKADGTYVEIWLVPESLDRVRNKDKSLRMGKYVRTSDRLPKGWLNMITDPEELALCRKAYRQMRRQPVTLEKLHETLGDFPLMVRLLTPFTSDFNGV